jgi:hypothetical protein
MLPPQARFWCSQLNQLIHSSNDFPLRESRKLIRDFEDDLYQSDIVDDRLVMFFSILSKLVATFDIWSEESSLENTFTEQHLSPFIKDIFKRPKNAIHFGLFDRLHLEKMEGHMSNHRFTPIYNKSNQVNPFVYSSILNLFYIH